MTKQTTFQEGRLVLQMSLLLVDLFSDHRTGKVTL